jgi:hypothetical protein
VASPYTWFDDTVIESRKSGHLSRGKRLEAVLQFFKHMNLNTTGVLDNMPVSTIFAPAVGIMGSCGGNHMNKNVIYLSPYMEFESKPEVLHSVAHEFAHLYLRHHENLTVDLDKTYDEQRHEIEVEELLTVWGIKAPQGGKKERRLYIHKVINQWAEERPRGKTAVKLMRYAMTVEGKGKLKDGAQ